MEPALRSESPSAGAPAELSRGNVWIYGSIGFPLAMLGYPLGIWLPRAYASEIGVELSWIGSVIFAAAIFDAVTDPAMGFASDRFRTRFGRRKSWVFGGTPLLAGSVWMLLNPEHGSGIAYLAFWYIFLRVGTTMILVPYAAWGAELSGSYHVRTLIQSSREKFVLLGLVAAAFVPAIPEWFGDGEATTALAVLRSYGWLTLLLLPSAVLWVLWKVPEPPEGAREGQTPFFESLRAMWRNRLFRLVVVIELLIAGGEAFRNTLSLFFMQDVIGAKSVGNLYLVYFSMGLLAIPAWDALAKRFGKHRSLSFAMILVSVVSVSIFALRNGPVEAFYLLFSIKGFCFGAFAYLPRAMLADVIDLDTARTGDPRTGSYFAAYGFMTKCAASFGGLSLPVLAMVGYDATPGSAHAESDLLWLSILYALVPTATFALALYLCWSWPLGAERHARIQRALERRNQRLKAAAAEAAATLPR